jgi:hypothetical protein
LKLKPPLLAGTTYILYFVATSTLYGTKRYEVQYQNQSMNVHFSPVVVGLFRVIAYHQANLLNPFVCEASTLHHRCSC